jgi:hypothetical protein
MAWVFAASDFLALTVTCAIGLVYLIGSLELLRFRQATATLIRELACVPKNMTSLGQWLQRLDPTLKRAVQLRIEGERTGLPGPVLTPYLVGLLVMLGLLGTFLGMVETLKGAVVALEGTADLQAIRAGLVAPINGLGFAFGTSVAGVAASAVLGLMLTMSRGERVSASRVLDARIPADFHQFSDNHYRDITQKALLTQAELLPELVAQLHAMVDKLDNLGETLSDALINNQQQFHHEAKKHYEGLAVSIDRSLRASIADSGRLAGESIQPIVKEVMTGWRAETQKMQAQLSGDLAKELSAVAKSFAQSTTQIGQSWHDGVRAQAQSNDALAQAFMRSQIGINEQFEEISASLLSAFEGLVEALTQQQASADQSRLDAWHSVLQDQQAQVTRHLGDAAAQLTQELVRLGDGQKAALGAVIEQFQCATRDTAEQLQQAGMAWKSYQSESVTAFKDTAIEFARHNKETGAALVAEISRLVNATDVHIKDRAKNEATWLAGQHKRMEALTAMVASQLDALHDAELERGNTAVERLALLESTVGTHLSKLGQALEEPMTRLIETASETPRVAAKLIGELRSEIADNVARESTYLVQRGEMMQALNALSDTLAQSARDHGDAIEKLIQSATNMLSEVSVQFAERVCEETSKFTDASDFFAGTALEISSLGDGFGKAVKLFNETNVQLSENLSRIEGALDQSATRQNEQLAYYVAQAREIIDYSMLSQRDLVEALHHSQRHNEPETTEVI